MMPRLLFLVATIPSIWILWQSWDVPLMGLWGDDTIYYSSAKSIAEGNGYRLPSLEGRPFQTKYPPLFPILLSLAWKLNPNYPENLTVAILLVWLAVPVYLWLVWQVLEGMGLDRKVALVGVFLLAINGQILFYGGVLMSEIWFSVALLATIACTLQNGTNTFIGRHSAWLSGTLASVAYLIKASALPLVFALPVGYLLRREGAKAWRSVVPMLVAIGVWNAWARMHAPQSTDLGILYHTSYIGYYLKDLDWTTFRNIVSTNFGLLYYGIPNMFFLVPASRFETALTLFLLIASPVGIFWLCRKSGNAHYAIFAVVYLIQLVSWNFMPTARLMLPLLPLLLAGLLAVSVASLKFLQTDESVNGISPIVPLATVVMSGALSLYLVLVSFGNLSSGLPSAIRENRALAVDRSHAYAWIRNNTPADASILAYDDQLLYLNTGRRSASQVIPATLHYRHNEQALHDEVRKLPEYAKKRNMEYVMITSTDLRRDNLDRYQPEVDRMLQEDPDFNKVYEGRKVIIYRVRKVSTRQGSE